jgi:hypothetical protein
MYSRCQLQGSILPSRSSINSRVKTGVSMNRVVKHTPLADTMQGDSIGKLAVLPIVHGSIRIHRGSGSASCDWHESSILPTPFHPSSFIPHPSSLILHPSSFIPHPSSLIPHPSSLIPHPSPSPLHPPPHPRRLRLQINPRRHRNILNGDPQRLEHSHIFGMGPPRIPPHDHLAQLMD